MVSMLALSTVDHGLFFLGPEVNQHTPFGIKMFVINVQYTRPNMVSVQK